MLLLLWEERDKFLNFLEKAYIISLRNQSLDEVRNDLNYVKRRVAEDCEQPIEYVNKQVEIISKMPDIMLKHIYESVGTAWNQLNRERFLDLISGKYADKKHIAVSCGYNHNEVFRPLYGI